MNRNIIIITSLSLGLIIFGIFMTTFGIIKLSNLTVEKNFPSSILNEEFELMIYTPPAYSLNFKQNYPVLYLLDAEKYFIERKEERRARWSVQKTIDRLIKEEHLPELIVVAISSTENRTNYYTPSQEQRYPGSGQAEKYAQFVIEELKPYIDTKYRTRSGAEDTGIAGTGLGGLASLYIGWENSDVISKIGALTPYLWWNDYSVKSMLEDSLEKNTQQSKIWLAVGPINDELQSPLSTEQLAADVEMLQGYLLQSGYYSEQDVYVYQAEANGEYEDELEPYFESLLIHLFSE